MDAGRLSSGQSAILHLLRYFFAQIVLLVHLLYFFESRNPLLDAFGNYVVVLFFVMSGFVICYRMHSLQGLADQGWSVYIMQRIHRIYPALLGALTLTWLLDYFSKTAIHWPYSNLAYVRSYVVNAFQLEEFPLLDYLEKHFGLAALQTPVFGSNLPLWTLAPEWWLYVSAGLIFLAYPHHKNKAWFWLAVVIALISPLYYITHFTRVGIGLTIPWVTGFFVGHIQLKTWRKPRIRSSWLWISLAIA
ncbi:MAG: acyltransferase family protein, partial [Flavobacteriales bacterium]